MDRHGAMIDLSEAEAMVDLAARAITPLQRSVPPSQAMGGWLAVDVCCAVDQPPFDKSAMDGYALSADDESNEYEIVETVTAGQLPKYRLDHGKTIKVMTGAPLPEGAARVEIVEHAQETRGRVRFVSRSRRANICRRGEDVRVGDVVLKAGRRLGPANIAAMTACGVDSVRLMVPPTVAVISTGDELVTAPRDLSPGKIMDANGPMLNALCTAWGMKVTQMALLHDQPEALARGLETALTNAEIILMSGGVSAGDYDYVPEALKRCGADIRFDRVAIKPGKPSTFAVKERALIFGLPGNPVSVFMTFHVFVARALRAMMGCSPPGLRTVRMRLAESFRRRDGERREYVPARLDERSELRRLEFHGSGHLTALTDTDGFFVVERGVLELAPGAAVDWLALSPYG